MLIAEAGLIKGERIGVDASTMEANAALRNIVRRDNGEGYREMLERLAWESGVETPTAENLARLDRKRVIVAKLLADLHTQADGDVRALVTVSGGLRAPPGVARRDLEDESLAGRSHHRVNSGSVRLALHAQHPTHDVDAPAFHQGLMPRPGERPMAAAFFALAASRIRR